MKHYKHKKLFKSEIFIFFFHKEAWEQLDVICLYTKQTIYVRVTDENVNNSIYY